MTYKPNLESFKLILSYAKEKKADHFLFNFKVEQGLKRHKVCLLLIDI